MRRLLDALLGFILIVVIAGVITLLIILSRSISQELIEEDGVWICTGAYATRYHCDRDCEGLNMCGSAIEQISLEDAEAQGRTECRWCY